MKKLTTLLVLVLTSLVVSACEITVVPIESPYVALTEAVYASEYTYNGRSVICDDRTTHISVEGHYKGSAIGLEFYLTGENGGFLALESHSLAGSGGSFNENLSISRYSAPLSATSSSGLDAQILEVERLLASGIIVVPRPVIIGYTRLGVTLEGSENSDSVFSSPILVLSECG